VSYIGWLDRPEQHPHRCPLTLQDSPADGPYYSSGFEFFDAYSSPDGPRPHHALSVLYLSPQAIQEACDATGSPFVLTTVEDHADLMARHEALIAERDDLSAQLEEARAEIAEFELLHDPEVFADSIVVRLDERYAKKAGPKPTRPAA
jgi:hypothetical protein